MFQFGRHFCLQETHTDKRCGGGKCNFTSKRHERESVWILSCSVLCLVFVPHIQYECVYVLIVLVDFTLPDADGSDLSLTKNYITSTTYIECIRNTRSDRHPLLPSHLSPASHTPTNVWHLTAILWAFTFTLLMSITFSFPDKKEDAKNATRSCLGVSWYGNKWSDNHWGKAVATNNKEMTTSEWQQEYREIASNVDWEHAYWNAYLAKSRQIG